MALFKRKTKEGSPLTDKAAGRFAALILKTQTKWANYMNRVTARWTPGQKTVALILFCAVMGANSGIALYKAVNASVEKSLVTLRPDRIRELTLPADTFWDGERRRRVQQVAAAIDSLGKTDSGRQWLRQLQQSRPGLWDSIKTVTSHYK